MRPRFLSQKMAAKEEENWMPSTQAKATRRSAKELLQAIQRSAQSVFRRTAGTVSGARKRASFSAGSRT